MDAVESLNKTIYKIELFLLKIIPFVLATVCLVNTTLSYFKIDIPFLSKEQFFNTLVHEAKHAQSHICKYYHVEEDSEDAAYLIGYIVQKMYKVFKNVLSTGIS